MSGFTIDPATAARIGLVPVGPGDWRVEIPSAVNIASDTVTRHALGARANDTAIRFEAADGHVTSITWAELERQANQFARFLVRCGVGLSDRVAIQTGARIETVVAHLACYKIGAIATTLSALFGPQTTACVLVDCGASVLITQDQLWQAVVEQERVFADLRHIVTIGGKSCGVVSFADCLLGDGGALAPVRTVAETPALLIYTSGSTGQPKGVLHGHGILAGYRPTLELFFNLELDEPDLVFWTAADWAWVGGLIDVVYPALLYGYCLIASEARFDPVDALDLMARQGVTHTLLTPTALNRLAAVADPHEGRRLRLRTIFTGGEALPPATLSWLDQKLGVVCNEGYGMSEVNHMIGNCRALRPIKPGSMGWQFPGHVVRLEEPRGQLAPIGTVGEIVTRADGPTAFLGYWGQESLDCTMRDGPYLRTGDYAWCDGDGYYWYCGRKDDLIKSAGYRIGPAEIEFILHRDPDVEDAAVVGVPDPLRGQRVVAVVRCRDDGVGSDALALRLKQAVHAALGPYKTPRDVIFWRDMPMTRTGKIARSTVRLWLETKADTL